MKKIIILIMQGICYGCTISTLITLCLAFTADGQVMSMAPLAYLRHTVCSMMVGVGFVVPTVVYRNEKLRLGFQVAIHMGIGLTVYLICAFTAGWLPIEMGAGAVITTLLSTVVITFLIWLAFYLYHRKEASRINEKISNLHRK